MSVYVDDLQHSPPSSKWPYSHYCHLTADTEIELHEFAINKLNLKRSWFQYDSRIPHYDLTSGKRAMAVRQGAVELNRTEMAVLIRKWRQK